MNKSDRPRTIIVIYKLITISNNHVRIISDKSDRPRTIIVIYKLITNK